MFTALFFFSLAHTVIYLHNLSLRMRAFIYLYNLSLRMRAAPGSGRVTSERRDRLLRVHQERLGEDAAAAPARSRPVFACGIPVRPPSRPTGFFGSRKAYV